MHFCLHTSFPANRYWLNQNISLSLVHRDNALYLLMFSCCSVEPCVATEPRQALDSVHTKTVIFICILSMRLIPYAVLIIVPMSKHAQASFPLTVITNGCIITPFKVLCVPISSILHVLITFLLAICEWIVKWCEKCDPLCLSWLPKQSCGRLKTWRTRSGILVTVQTSSSSCFQHNTEVPQNPFKHLG